MKMFFKQTRNPSEGDSVEASFENDCIVLKSTSEEDLEYVVLDKSDWEAIISNYQGIIETENKKKKGGK
jgi:hypothetical protein